MELGDIFYTSNNSNYRKIKENNRIYYITENKKTGKQTSKLTVKQFRAINRRYKSVTRSEKYKSEQFNVVRERAIKADKKFKFEASQGFKYKNELYKKYKESVKLKTKAGKEYTQNRVRFIKYNKNKEGKYIPEKTMTFKQFHKLARKAQKEKIINQIMKEENISKKAATIRFNKKAEELYKITINNMMERDNISYNQAVIRYGRLEKRGRFDIISRYRY